MTSHRSAHRLKPIAAAIGMTAALPAFADNGMPGAGLVVRNQGYVQVNGVALPGGDQILGLANKATIVTDRAAAPSYGTVIQWGSPTVVDSANAKGFNVAKGNTLTFDCTGGTCGYLNVDIGGSLSNVAGTINLASANVTSFWIANEKGVAMASGSTVGGPGAAGANVSLVGANLNTLAAIDGYSGKTTVPFNFAGNAPVTMAGDLSGAKSVTIAGSGAVNVTGKIPAVPGSAGNSIDGGVGGWAQPELGLVFLDDGKGKNTSARTDVTLKLGSDAVPFDFTAGKGTWVEANGDLNTRGALAFGADNPSIHLEWVGALNNSGSFLTTAAFEVTVPTSIYNGGTVPVPFGGLVNSGTIDTGFYFDFRGTGAFENSGSITAGGIIQVILQGKGNSIRNSGTLTTDSYVNLGATGSAVNTGTISSGSAYLSANILGEPGSFVASNSGTIEVTAKGGQVRLSNNGSGDVTVGGTVTAKGSGSSLGLFSAEGSGATSRTTVDTPITVQSDVSCASCAAIIVKGNGVVVNKALTVVESTPGAGAGRIYVSGVTGQAPATVTWNANAAAGDFQIVASKAAWPVNVALNANLTTTENALRIVEIDGGGSVRGAGIITANRVYLDVQGSVNNGLGSPNSLLNGLAITTVGPNPWVGFWAHGAGRQAVNLKIAGDAMVSSTDTVSAGSLFPYFPAANAQSSLLIQASGNLVVDGTNCGGGGITGCGFHFPGGVAFVAGGSLAVAGSVDNAWTGNAIPFQGQYYESVAGVITMSGPLFTNGNSWINYSVRPTGPLPTVYGAREVPNLLGFVTLSPFLNADASHLNSYTLLMTTAAAGGDWVSLVNPNPIR